jgi:non-specific serine/threonine protein kinase/serine/threonine-protein kinase
MTGDRSRRVEELFERALGLSGPERDEFLDRECAGDPEIRAEIDSLLSHHSEEFLEDPEHLLDASTPDRIGAYRLVRLLGSGGMGEVHLAEQEEPVRRTVALKLIKLGMDTNRVVARFDGERQALAMMNHPNIAHVYDAGATERGRPYFVMEYVEGEPITTHCDRNRLDLQDRLALFLRVCDGLQHAHQKGIIHRDIKPSNVLVTMQDGQPVPKIIDFGIAKATDQHQAEATAFTEMGRVVGTPAYMSPEQTEWNRPDIDTRTDVYSLGVLLYELLVGARPFDTKQLRDAGFEEMCRVIREVEAPRPSTRLKTTSELSGESAANRGSTPEVLVRQLRGDLDWIVLRALEKERDRRYSSASEMAADLRRHLADEPVLARPPATTYRIRKFVRRHRLGVAAAVVVLLALVAGIIGTTAAMLHAQREEMVARETERFMVSAFAKADPHRSAGEPVTARQILDHSAAKVREEFDDEPDLQGRLMLAIGESYSGLGEFALAEPLLRDSLGILRESEGANHEDVARALNGLANALVRQQRQGEAIPFYEEALTIWRTARDPEDEYVTTLLRQLGNAHLKVGQFDLARPYIEEALAADRDRLGPESLEYAKSLNTFGNLLAREDDPESAVPFHEEALRIRQKAAESPNDLALGFGHYFLGDTLLRAGRHEEAAREIATALEIWERGADPTHERVGACSLRLAEALEAGPDPASAEPYFLQAIEIDEANFGKDDPALIEALEGYSEYLRSTGRDTEVEPVEARIAEIRGAAGPND